MTDLKKCNRCGEEKPLEQFYKFHRDKDKTIEYSRPECKHCFNRSLMHGKRKKRYDELLSGKSGETGRRRKDYQENRKQILEKKRRRNERISKESKDALKEGDLTELMDLNNGKNKRKQLSKDRKGTTDTKVRCGTRRSKDKTT